jgi:hypothetical protein
MKLVRVGYVDFKVGKKPKFIGKRLVRSLGVCHNTWTRN